MYRVNSECMKKSFDNFTGNLPGGGGVTITPNQYDVCFIQIFFKPKQYLKFLMIFNTSQSDFPSLKNM